MCFVWIWEQTAIISLYNINWLVFVTETQCVYCAVRTVCLYRTWTLKGQCVCVCILHCDSELLSTVTLCTAICWNAFRLYNENRIYFDSSTSNLVISCRELLYSYVQHTLTHTHTHLLIHLYTRNIYIYTYIQLCVNVYIRVPVWAHVFRTRCVTTQLTFRYYCYIFSNCYFCWLFSLQMAVQCRNM